MSDFQDRVAVITGGASGIGAAMARAFAERGARLVLADIDPQTLGDAEREHADRGTEVLAVRTDVTKREEVFALADAAWSRFGGVHIVCNNAGVATYGDISKAPPEDWEFTMNVNFWGVAYGVQAFVPRLIEQGTGGHVVNTASMAGLVGMSWLGIYNASKFAVVGLSESLFRELRPHGIGVSVLCPMVVETNLDATTAKNRPQHLQPSGEVAPQPSASDIQGTVKQPEEVALRVVRAIERRQLYVPTHDEQREILKRRAERLDAAFEPGNWNL
jgi:NAD(P)-dependent dehydrogenase (short-subunit alcohol dehydrogenase family)